MTPEEKELLLKDLSARIPYQPLCKKIDTEDDFCECDGPLGYSLRDFVSNNVIIKPYLRPMSSMTDEETDLMWEIYENNAAAEGSSGITDFLNELYLNHHHLIEKGLALEAPKDMYKTE